METKFREKRVMNTSRSNIIIPISVYGRETVDDCRFKGGTVPSFASGEEKTTDE
jgi:hypothetical protein